MTLNFKTAKQLLEDQHSCLKLTTVSKHISLSPKYLGNVASGIKEQLNSLIGLYSDKYLMFFSYRFSFYYPYYCKILF